jgi:hypothetical protein
VLFPRLLFFANEIKNKKKQKKKEIIQTVTQRKQIIISILNTIIRRRVESG